MIWLALGLGLLALWLWRRSNQLRASTGLPWRTVVYHDTARRELTKALFSARYQLTGKPDYVLADGKALIPVEVKPQRQATSPRQGDILQLAAYCLLLRVMVCCATLSIPSKSIGPINCIRPCWKRSTRCAMTLS